MFLKFKSFKFLLIIALVFCAQNIKAQEGKLTVYEDKRITELLALKSNLNKENKLSDGFTIQLYYGELSGANSTIRNYRRAYTDWPSSIEYETPNYKVWVGNFITRLEADRALLEIKNQFPNAFIFKPERRN
ncbi:MAG: SPOR domain-containing protein [Flavobacteriales bacterium]|jgi:hypothetical protein|nr:SPOR domain-containing protein [Flavobacteriales bacterium]